MSEYIVRVDGQIPDAIYERELAEIVRCRNCVCFDTAEPQGCTLFDFAAPNHADGFCAWGERKESEE